MSDPVYWISCHWPEGDVLFLFELDAGGWVLRQVELKGPERTPIAAAQAGAEEQGFGFTAEVPEPQWVGHEPVVLTAGEFEAAWVAARAALNGPA